MTELFDCDDVGKMTEYVWCKIEPGKNYIKFAQLPLMQNFKDEFDLPNKEYQMPVEPKKQLVPVKEDMKWMMKYRQSLWYL